jgi:septum site-determining protein MinD
VVYDISDVLMGRCKPVNAIVPVSGPGNLHLMAAPLDRFFVADADNLQRLIAGLLGYYDHLIIDSGAGMGSGLEVCLKAADSALVIVQAEPICVRDAQRLVGVLDAGGIPEIRLVVNRFERRRLGGTLPDLDAVIDQAGAQIIALVPEDKEVSRACAAGEALSSKSAAGKAFKNLAGRVSGREIRISEEICR